METICLPRASSTATQPATPLPAPQVVSGPPPVDDGSSHLLRPYGVAIRALLRKTPRTAKEAEDVFREVLPSHDPGQVMDIIAQVGIVAAAPSGVLAYTELAAEVARCLEYVGDELLAAIPIAHCAAKKQDPPQQATLCRALSQGEVPPRYTELVEKALETYLKNAPPRCIPYAADIPKITSLLRGKPQS
ncbi:hypothetical protein ODS41_02400 [Pyrobaculum sp. 3827-6]|uniref:hypothetical protein n=1 Tax=Pyrobaculum sp. 3827-6 TaxID=2983604 RepID=UPI0021DB4024|nr:hypothetical protein [Pyrobaculum sp. 3827-6]MCU7786781.1 hypothetical protein [Pyrobaculum sp. 3827-6]